MCPGTKTCQILEEEKVMIKINVCWGTFVGGASPRARTEAETAARGRRLQLVLLQASEAH